MQGEQRRATNHKTTKESGKMKFSIAPVLLMAIVGVRALSSLSSVANKVAGARTLGGSDLVVSEACLGTMTWGLQNTQEEAFEQIDYALNECGVNFMDTAELYPYVRKSTW